MTPRSIRSVLLAQLALVAVALVLVMRVVRRAFGELPSLVVGCLYAFGTGFLESRLDGMEGAVTMVAFALLLVALTRFGLAPSNRNAMWVAAVCVAVVLGRLDALAVIWIVPIALALRTRQVEGRRLLVRGVCRPGRTVRCRMAFPRSATSSR